MCMLYNKKTKCSFILFCFNFCMFLSCCFSGRSLPRRAPDDIIMSNICNWFDKFVKDLVQRKCKTYKAMLQTIELEQDQDSESESEEDKIIVNQPSAIQALWAFQKTREVCKMSALCVWNAAISLILV